MKDFRIPLKKSRRLFIIAITSFFVYLSSSVLSNLTKNTNNPKYQKTNEKK
ncbi:hypothetical protein B4135_2729 [Caldibacillus debilis]|uniref:Uncharacterized protein n=1 Tax=Caldibacillus debilis TaxID=301148 RepID=A0A150LSK5_9BACI|nr:hypothetical protein B4135_2729 [Caldibacillus debilis]